MLTTPQLDFATYFANFSLAYGYLDVDSVIEFYALPFEVTFENECNTWIERASLHDTLTALYAWMQQQGFHQPHYEIIEAQRTDGTAYALLKWRIVNNYGQRVSYFNRYQMQCIAGEWKITGIIRTDDEAALLVVPA